MAKKISLFSTGLFRHINDTKDPGKVLVEMRVLSYFSTEELNVRFSDVADVIPCACVNSNGNLEVLKVILRPEFARWVDVNAKFVGWSSQLVYHATTAIMYAVNSGDAAMLTLLLKHVNIIHDPPADNLKTPGPIWTACNMGNNDLITTFLESGKVFDFSSKRKLDKKSPAMSVFAVLEASKASPEVKAAVQRYAQKQGAELKKQQEKKK